MESALLVVLGAALGYLGGWLADVRRSKEESRTRWLDIRRVTYAEFAAAVRDVREPLSSCVRGTLPRAAAVTSAQEALLKMESKRAELWLIAEAAPSDAATWLRDWCQDAELTLRNPKYGEEDLRTHLKDFDGPFSRFFDASRIDLGLDPVKTAFHLHREWKRPSGRPNPYVPSGG